MSTHPTTALIDRFGRKVEYVRLSVTDRCDFRCVYCMAEDMTFLPRNEILSLEEIYRVAATFVSLGVKKIRLTGGEPLIRRDVLKLVQRLGQLPGLELVLTTNGSQLPHMAQDLKDAGVRRLNISLDSLNTQKFRELTRTGDLQQVLNGIQAAKAAGFKGIKLNAVILKGRNDDEILPLVDFARTEKLDLTFIEEMPLGAISEHGRQECYMPSDAIRAIIEKHYPLIPSLHDSGGPARYYDFVDAHTRIGFISPHSHNFCGDCNRVRVTVEGRLLLCLGNEHSADLRAVLRSSDDDAVLQQAIVKAMDLKPERHHFNLEEEPQIVRFMNMTGG